jgi:protein FRG1
MYSSGDDNADRKALKRAIKEGRAAEELLDRRSKMKSDKFA